jgi:hypothetical protein
MCRPGGDDPANFPSHRVDDSDDAVGLWADRQRPDFSVSDGLKLDPEFLQSEHGIFKVDAVLCHIAEPLLVIPLKKRQRLWVQHENAYHRNQTLYTNTDCIYRKETRQPVNCGYDLSTL